MGAERFSITPWQQLAKVSPDPQGHKLDSLSLTTKHSHRRRWSHAQHAGKLHPARVSKIFRQIEQPHHTHHQQAGTHPTKEQFVPCTQAMLVKFQPQKVPHRGAG